MATTPPWKLWLCTAALLIATTIALHPALRADFLSWDDTAYVSMNKLLQSTDGLTKIWDPSWATKDQYYPLVFTSYWLEYRLWGAKSTGYHAVNLGLHLTNIVLVALLIRALGGSGWVVIATASVFALHPLQVASVAWIAERKNVLSGFFYLIAFLAYLHHRRTNRWGSYGGCLLGFIAALLSKTQTVTLPASLLLAEYLLNRPARLRPVQPMAVARRIAPMVALGVVAVLVTARVEHENVEWSRMPTAAERPLIAANAPWFYVMKVLAPVGLAPIYGKWDIAAAGMLPWIGVVAWPLVLALIVRHREQIGALSLWGIAHFFVSLTPVLGLVPFGLQQHTFVADHFVYLAMIGAGLALGVWVERLAGQLSTSRGHAIASAAGLLLLGVYGVQSYRESLHWRNDETFWRHVIVHNPESLPAQQSLGFYYRNQGRWGTALPFFRKAAEIRPDNPRIFHAYVDALRKVEGGQAAVEASDAKLKEEPGMVVAYLERAQSYEALGRAPEALADYDRVLRSAATGSEEWQLAQRGRSRLTSGALQ